MTVSADVQITDLGVHDHACLTFGDAEEQLDLTAAFVADGLSRGLKVVWLSAAAVGRPAADLARRGVAAAAALASGQLAAASSEGMVPSGQAFGADRALGWLTAEALACRVAGFAGLRLALDMSWALRPVSGVEQLPDFENGVAAALAGTDAALLCQYDRERFDPVTLASAAALHSRSVAAATYHADAVLRICRQYAPSGIRLAGEIDYRAEEPLALALAEAIRLEGDITVNMAALGFMDVSCMAMILNAARSLAGSRRVILQCPAGIGKGFGLLGTAEVPGVSVVTTDER